MKNIKKYEDFVNEEINWRKAATGVALGASLLGGQSCEPSEEEKFYARKNREVEVKDSIRLSDIKNTLDRHMTLINKRFDTYKKIGIITPDIESQINLFNDQVTKVSSSKNEAEIRELETKVGLFHMNLIEAALSKDPNIFDDEKN